jgi:CubicO group peptidase (beta-lactamase class C family)
MEEVIECIVVMAINHRLPAKFPSFLSPRLPLLLMSRFARSLLSLAILVLALAAAATFLRADDSNPPSDGGLAANLQPFVDKGILPGGIVLVADKDKILDLETFGYSDYDNKVPMKPDALMMIASMTKTFTAVGLMMLVEEGKVSLDDPVEKYLPAFKGQMVDDPANPGHPHPPQHPITIRECMSHTAGLHHGRRREVFTTVVEDASEIGKLPLDYEPGTKYLYSEGPLVAGAVIEVVTGMKYGDFIKQRILDPLGMTDSSFWPDEKLSERLALTGKWNDATQKLENLHQNDAIINDPAKYAPVPRRFQSQNNLAISNYKNHFTRPDGGLFSTITDVSKFCRMLLNNGTYEGKFYITPASVKEIATIQTKDLFPNPHEGYGIGTFVQRLPSDDGPSVGSFGHRGARKTVMWVDPHDQLVLILFTQKWELKNEEQQAINRAFFQPAIAKYAKPLDTPATVTVH